MCYSLLYRKKWDTLNDFDEHLDLSAASMKKESVRTFPRGLTRVLAVGSSGQVTLPEMTYSLVPSWSKEPTIKWATYNARLTRPSPDDEEEIQKIYDVPTWRESIGSMHCLVPVTEFFESCRGGLADGFEVAFHTKDFSTLYIAGIYSVWRGQLEGKKVVTCSFAAITTEPSEFIQSVGHDRSPLFLSREFGKIWISEKFNSGKSAFDFLNNHKHQPELDFTKIRKMKAS